MQSLIDYASQFISGTELQIFVLFTLCIFVAFGLKILGWMFGQR